MTATAQRLQPAQANLIFAVFMRLHDSLRLVDYEQGIVSVREGRVVNDYPFRVEGDTLHYNGKHYCVKPKDVSQEG